MSHSKTITPHAIQFVDGIPLLSCAALSSLHVPLTISLATAGTRFTGRTGWKMADCRVVPWEDRTLVYELEVHGTFGALLWRARRRTWQRYRKREVMPQGDGGKGGSDREDRSYRRKDGEHNTRANVVVVREHRVRRRNWRKLSYFWPAENKERVGETYEKRNAISCMIYRSIFFVLSGDWEIQRVAYYLYLASILLRYRCNARNDGQR